MWRHKHLQLLHQLGEKQQDPSSTATHRIRGEQTKRPAKLSLIYQPTPQKIKNHGYLEHFEVNFLFQACGGGTKLQEAVHQAEVHPFLNHLVFKPLGVPVFKALGVAPDPNLRAQKPAGLRWTTEEQRAPEHRRAQRACRAAITNHLQASSPCHSQISSQGRNGG